jgi:hypothetical protein
MIESLLSGVCPIEPGDRLEVADAEQGAKLKTEMLKAETLKAEHGAGSKAEN